jgi:AraC-like DNA-binding protein
MRDQLRALYARGFTVSQMATEIKRSKRYVYRHLTRALR